MVRSRMRGSYLDDQRDEARSVAKLAVAGCTVSAGIARRSCARGRWSSVGDAQLDLGHEKMQDHVREVRTVARRRKKATRGWVVAGAHRKRRSTAVAVAAQRA